MSLTGAFATGLSGLDANSQNIDIIGNNIANVNTPSYKAKRALFTTQFMRNLSLGSPPSGASGGTNPMQVGLGTRIGGIQTDFTNGGISGTGIATNMAIEGNGFFIVEQANEQFYTRDGQFALNSENKLTTATGALVQGYAVDQNFNIVPGVLNDLDIQIGSLTIAEATGNVNFEGNLNAAGEVSSGGSLHDSRTFFTDAALTPGNEEAGATDLTVGGNNLYIDDGAGGSFLAFEGGTDTIITISGVEKAGQALASKTFAFSTDPTVIATVDDAGTNINDFIAFINDALGLSSVSINGETLGGGASLVAGEIVIAGNEGAVQDLLLETGHITASSSAPGFSGIANPMVMQKTQAADGEAGRTSFVVFDSLGTEIQVDLTFIKQSVVPDGGTVWQWVAESNDNDALPRIVGLGNVEFDQNGVFVSASNSAFSLTRLNGADDPLTVNMVFDNGIDSITALASTSSVVSPVRQDGSPLGTLDEFSVGEDGTITGSFTNGLTRTIGQVAIATFINNDGLIEAGNNMYTSGANSGNAVIGTPLTLGAGRVVAGAIEQSNVDLAEEFVNLITSSTGFSAASRVITTTDQMLQQLLLIGR